MNALRVAVTGGYGFIGSAVVRSLRAAGSEVVNVDALTYAASVDRLSGTDGVHQVRLDVRDETLRDVFASFAPQVVVHLAAETHVTRSEKDPDSFFTVNVEGTRNVLGAARLAGALVLHVSTDEVYGPSAGLPFKETEKLSAEGAATSPYARSKALADDLAVAAAAEQGVIVARLTNCFGPWQHPEKAIPRWITRALLGNPLPVWGDGRYVRDWMFVDDAVRGILMLLEHGQSGEVYNLGPGDSSITNLEIARSIAQLAGAEPDRVTLTEYDRPQHDRMYAVNVDKSCSLGWDRGRDLREGLRVTVHWFRNNEAWWRPLLAESEALYADAEARK